MSRLMDLIGGEVVAAGNTVKNGSSVSIFSVKKDRHYFIVEAWTDKHKTQGGCLNIEDILSEDED